MTKWTRMEIYGFGADLILNRRGIDNDTRFVLRSVDGLGPPEKELYITTDVNGFGGFQNDLPSLRELVILIGLNPKYDSEEPRTAADLRSNIYRRLYATAYHSSMSMAFFNGDTQVGYIDALFAKKIEINPFSDDPQVQVTLNALSPYIIGDAISVDTDGMDPTDFSFQYEGEDSTGFDILGAFTGNKSNLVLDQGGYAKFMEIEYDFLTDDLLLIDTRTKRIRRNRSGSWKDLTPYLSGPSNWLKISPGNNTFSFNTSNFTFYSVSYEAVLWGL